MQLSTVTNQIVLQTCSSQNFAKWSRKLNFTLVFAYNKKYISDRLSLVDQSMNRA